MSDNSALAVIQWARYAQRDFLLRNFFTFAKHSGMCPDITEDEYGEICEWLESRLPDRKGYTQKFGLFLTPRLTYKTSLISALCVYVFLLDAEIRIVLGRASTQLAMFTLHGIKSAFEINPTIKSAFGDQRARFEKWTEEFVTVEGRMSGAREPTIMTTGLNTSQTGQHPDLVILDDLVNEQNFESAKEMQSARQLVQAYYPILERWGSLLLSGTRWGDNDVYGWILEQDELRVETGRSAIWDQYVVGAYNRDGTLRYPNVLPESRIEHLRTSIDPKMFAAWILNVARAQGEDIFTLAYVQYFDGEYIGGPFGELRLADSDPLRRKFGSSLMLYVVMLVDPAPTVGSFSDFTGVAVVGFDADGNWWVLWAEQVKKLPEARLQYLTHLAVNFQPRLISLENADMDIPLFSDRLRDIGLITTVTNFDPRMDRAKITANPRFAPRGRTKKAAQIEGLEPILRARKVYFARGMTNELVRQLQRYPYLDHDDVLDAFSTGRAYEQRARIEATPDPNKYFEDVERREFAAEGIPFGNPSLSGGRPGAWAGPASHGRLRRSRPSDTIAK
jgi:hypothetical protein